MTVREIEGFLAEMYGVEVSPDLISTVPEPWTPRTRFRTAPTCPSSRHPAVCATSSTTSWGIRCPRRRYSSRDMTLCRRRADVCRRSSRAVRLLRTRRQQRRLCGALPRAIHCPRGRGAEPAEICWSAYCLVSQPFGQLAKNAGKGISCWPMCSGIGSRRRPQPKTTKTVSAPSMPRSLLRHRQVFVGHSA